MDYIMKLGMISLGCAKNRIDTELFLGVARKYNLEITNKMKDADILVVNTCGFIESAKKEAIDTILELTDYGKLGKTIIAMGCLVERYLQDLQESIPEVDFYFPISDYDKIDELFAKITHTNQHYKMDYTNRVVSTLPHSAYLRIAEGCDNRCAYCAIPLIRGDFRSRTYISLMDEVQALVNKGVKEITLIAQDTTRYGTDFGKDAPKIHNLIHDISEIPEIKIVRLLYLYPDEITDELLEEFETNKKLAPYFDIPIQHASNRLLKLMNRRGNQELIEERINNIRSRIPNVIIRTTLISGFPTETSKEHRELVGFVKKMRFDRLGVFTYSAEEDTTSYDMHPKVSEKVAEKRMQEIMKIQQEIINEKNTTLIGQTFEAIIDSYDPIKNKYLGRTYAYAPDDVDGCIYIESESPLIIGNIYPIQITKADVYDLEASIVNQKA